MQEKTLNRKLPAISSDVLSPSRNSRTCYSATGWMDGWSFYGILSTQQQLYHALK